MNIYAVKKIEITEGMTQEEYLQAIDEADVRYCKGVEGITAYVGGKLKRGRAGGYSGIIGNVEYIAERVG